MEITIAGAGAGKTWSMHEKIIELHEEIGTEKRIYCIAFTNNAVDCIRQRLVNHFGTLPSNITVSTIHSFLYQEIVRPYYYLLFAKQYKRIAISELPTDAKYRKAAIKRLEISGVLHQTAIPERAKWVLVKKSDDNADRKAKRRAILNSMNQYIGAICIDEAQDIDNHVTEIIQTLDDSIKIILMGDPKQDLKGFGNLRALLNRYPDNVTYLSLCYRCPQKHLDISNTIVPNSEIQYSEVKEGQIDVVFESDQSCIDLINSNVFDLAYISQKYEGYNTHNDNNANLSLQNIYEELLPILQSKRPNLDEITLNRWAYYNAHKLIEKYKSTGSKSKAMNTSFEYGFLSSAEYGIVINSIPDVIEQSESKEICISSIESIKGLEGNSCLFILTTDLAPYLLGLKKDENKVKNKLYVAMTRSKRLLTIYVPSDVEKKYGKETIQNVFAGSINANQE